MPLEIEEIQLVLGIIAAIFSVAIVILVKTYNAGKHHGSEQVRIDKLEGTVKDLTNKIDKDTIEGDAAHAFLKDEIGQMKKEHNRQFTDLSNRVSELAGKIDVMLSRFK